MGSKITADGDCIHEIKRCLLFGRKAMTNLDSIFKKQRHHFADKGPYSQSSVFSNRHVWMWELDHKEGWALKNWWFWIVCWKRLLRVPWGSNQSILKEINPEYSFEGLILKLQYFRHLMWRPDSLEQTLMLGKIEGRRRSGWLRMRLLGSFTDSVDMNFSKLPEIMKDRGA